MRIGDDSLRVVAEYIKNNATNTKKLTKKFKGKIATKLNPKNIKNNIKNKKNKATDTKITDRAATVAPKPATVSSKQNKIPKAPPPPPIGYKAPKNKSTSNVVEADKKYKPTVAPKPVRKLANGVQKNSLKATKTNQGKAPNLFFNQELKNALAERRKKIDTTQELQEEVHENKPAVASETVKKSTNGVQKNSPKATKTNQGKAPNLFFNQELKNAVAERRKKIDPDNKI